MARRRRSGWSGWDYGGYYPRSTPRHAEGGIKSQSRRGTFGESWWAKRWIQVLESFDIGARLARGRSYARSGQVLSIAITEGRVTAKVQGSRPKPYDVAIEVQTLSPAEWAKVLDALGRQAMFAAKLLAGEMPQDIEPVFQKAGVSLFPARRGDLKTRCSCPDASNPCKHIAAAYYLLGEEFDRDPFLIFTLRGLSREALTARLEESAPEEPDETTGAEPRPIEAIAPDPSRFWEGSAAPPDDPCGMVAIPDEPSALIRRLGSFPFWRGQSPFLETLNAIYCQASPSGIDVYLGPEGSTAEPRSPQRTPPASPLSTVQNGAENPPSEPEKARFRAGMGRSQNRKAPAKSAQALQSTTRNASLRKKFPKN